MAQVSAVIGDRLISDGMEKCSGHVSTAVGGAAVARTHPIGVFEKAVLRKMVIASGPCAPRYNVVRVIYDVNGLLVRQPIGLHSFEEPFQGHQGLKHPAFKYVHATNRAFKNAQNKISLLLCRVNECTQHPHFSVLV